MSTEVGAVSSVRTERGADHAARGVRCRDRARPTGPRIDLNFYLVALFRLCEVVGRALNLPHSETVRAALDEFNAAWPLKDLRNDEEHFRGPHLRSPLGVWYFP